MRIRLGIIVTIFLTAALIFPATVVNAAVYRAGASWSVANIGTGWASTTFRQVINARDLDQNGFEDLIATDVFGNLWLYPTSSSTKFVPQKKIGTGWNILRKIIGGADFDGYGKDYLLAVAADGKL